MNATENAMLTILVVLYGRQINDCLTLNVINKYLDASQWACINIHIFNNGPVFLSENFDFSLRVNENCVVNLHQDISNVPLSKLYNQFIPDEGVYLLLDQDTELTVEYFKSLVEFSKSNVNIFVPKLEHPGYKTYPICGVKLSSGVVHAPKLFSVSSAIALKKPIINQVITQYGNLFDDRFAFYGIDATFFIRLKNLNVCDYYIGPLIHHDLSGGLTLKQIDEWRYRERAIDSVLQLRNYPSLRCCLEFFKFFLRSPKGSFIKAAPELSKVFIKGVHPRCL